MVHASTQQLIRKLYELTGAGVLSWKQGERETSRLETEGYVVELEPAPPQIRLLRADGRELERADTDDLAAIAWPDGEGTFASRVAEMATRANRFARGAERPIPQPLSAISAPPKLPVASPRPLARLASFGKTQSFVKQPATQRPAMLIKQPAPEAKAPGSHIYKPWK